MRGYALGPQWQGKRRRVPPRGASALQMFPSRKKSGRSRNAAELLGTRFYMLSTCWETDTYTIEVISVDCTSLLPDAGLLVMHVAHG